MNLIGEVFWLFLLIPLDEFGFYTYNTIGGEIMRLRGLVVAIRETKTGKYLINVCDCDAPDKVVRVLCSENGFELGHYYDFLLSPMGSAFWCLTFSKVKDKES